MARPFAPATALSLALLLIPGAGHAQNGAPASPSPGWQATPWADSVMLQTQMRFELESPDGVGVSEQQWSRFVSEVILPRFADGVTVVDATAPRKTGFAAVRLVSILHPNTPDALGRIGEIATAFSSRFGGAKVSRFDVPVRVGN